MRASGSKQPGRATLLAGLDDAYVECRALGHDEAVELGYGVSDNRGRLHAGWAWLRALCRRCGREVERHYDGQFRPVSAPVTKYPPGYLLEGAGSGPYRREARAELWTRRAGAPPSRRRKARGGR
jgi:hypothetical protein